MVPEVDHIKMAILAWEEEEAKGGWDQDPLLVVGLNVSRFDGFGFVPVSPQPAEVHPHMPTALAKAVDLFESDVAGEVLGRGDLLRHDRFFGYFVMYEAWQGSVPADERDGRALADIPGSLEVREVMGVDCGGRLYYLSRVRGGAVTLSVFTDKSELFATGDAVESLVRLVKATSRFAPSDSRDLPALNALLRRAKARYR